MKSLFHEKTVLKALKNSPPPSDLDAKIAVIDRWVTTLKTGILNNIKEVSLHGDFLQDIFCHVLEYRSVIHGKGKDWTLLAEANISDGGGSADGAIGFFRAIEAKGCTTNFKLRVVAPIELKGAATDLDRPMHGRKESAVEQGWRYANYTEDCRWIIVSNYRELRLYRTSKTPAFYESFILEELTNLERLKRFCFLLGASNFLPDELTLGSQSRIDLLLTESENAEEEITNALYSEYKDTRLKLVRWLQENGSPTHDKNLLIETSQKILDRVLFIAFCEDRGLLPRGTFKNAHDHRDPYHPTSVWKRYKALFRWVDKGKDDPPIPGYNGGLFRRDPIIDDQIDLPDELCSELNAIARYDYDTDVSVEVLGHIFEQSITDLEELKAVATGKSYDKKKGKRKTQGVYYTPAFVTQYIVDLALGGYLRQKEEQLRGRIGLELIPEAHSKKLRRAEREFWITYRDSVLRKTRVLDPACGSGAFLIAAFDYLLSEYERVNNALASIEKGQRSLYDLNKTILNKNLYGVDLSKESVEITKLSLWLKTAERGKRLTFLDENIQHGNSIVEDIAVDPEAFEWHTRFPDVFDDGGFDVVLGNPPYVRQEVLGPIKPYLERRYRCYDGIADLYTYFYERGLEVLKPGGVLSFIVTNKWLKAGYGEALRRYFSMNAQLEQILDFGHARIFQDADVFPSIVAIRKPVACAETAPINEVVVCPVPREKLPSINLKQYVQQHGYSVAWTRFTEKPWSLENPAIDELMKKIHSGGIPLIEYGKFKPFRGILTGLNEVFIIDSQFRQKLILENPAVSDHIKPCLKGTNIKRWVPIWDGLWMIVMRSSSDFPWPWSDKQDTEAERIFALAYPSLYEYFKSHEEGLRKRQDQGRYWWELRSFANYNLLEKTAIIHTDITWRPQFSLSSEPMYLVNTAYAWPTKDLYLLAVVNSPVMWAYSWRNAMHGKDEALRFIYS